MRGVLHLADGLWAILWNIVGGALVAVGSAGLSRLKRWYRHRRFRQVFGACANGDTHSYLVYPEFVPDNPRKLYNKPPSKKKRNGTGQACHISAIASLADARAMSYLASAFGEELRGTPAIATDAMLDEKTQVSFVSFGGGTNWKTLDLFDNPSNLFFAWENGRFVNKLNASRATPGPDCDIGVIIKIRPAGAEAHTWICCAGYDETGTSGAAWFLANRWQQIQRRVKNSSFGIITETQIGSDESTQFRAGLLAIGPNVQEFSM